MTTTFTKEQLAEHARMNGVRLYNGYANPAIESNDLAAFALAQMEGKEADERELIERGKDIHTLTVALESERLRAERAEDDLAEAEVAINVLYDWAYAQTWTVEDDAVVNYVTPEMASDAGDPSMAGSTVYGKVSCDFCLAESGEPWRDLMDSNPAVRRAQERAK